ncbi:MAG TPA: PilZ domain-containing protein [Blastocatellia bacterium]|nr:PilZ domain-containing protein [Blastocatellia bacterium]
MSSESKSEARRYRRVEGLFPVSLFCQGETYRVKATNLSLGGIFIATRLPLRVGALVHMRITGLPERASVQATGQVRFVHQGIGVGIRFHEIAESDLKIIAEVVENNNAPSLDQDPELPTRDTRLQLSLKLKVNGKDQTGQPFEEEVYTEDVSRRGVCLRLNCEVGVGDVVRLSGLDGQFQVEGVVKYAHACEGQWRVGVQFLSTPKRWIVVGMAVSALSQWDVRPAK